MCGVAGALSLRGARPPDSAELSQVIGTLHHRGPDATGVEVYGAAGLAHARLSIIDLEGGQQPIHNEDRSVWVVFNGEIFNYVELRADLEKRGHRFYTTSDTEVIVHLYEEHGQDFVDALNGQFAIAIWDIKQQRLVLARDRAGIRPLFYCWHQGRFWFASENKALLSLPGMPRRLNRRALGEIFTFWSPLEPTGWFEGITPLPPGCTLTITPDDPVGTARPRRYWDWSFDPDAIDEGRSLEDCAEEMHALLADAVKIQLRADVPVGAYLSGGLDSSVIAALIRSHTDVHLRTFSVTFEDQEFDESAHQDTMIQQLGSEHSRMLCRQGDIGDAFPTAVWHTEIPVVRTAPTPLMLLSGLVRREGYKVVLTGEGSDEVFAGYDLFKEAQIRRFCARRPQSQMRPRILDRLYPYLEKSPTAAPSFARSFFSQGQDQIDKPYFGHLPRWSTTRRIWRLFSPAVRDEIGAFDPLAAVESLLPADIKRWPALGRDQYIEAHILLSTYLLSSQGDRMAMANSIEARFPFLDHRVIELAARLPPLYKLHGLKEKHILKRAVGHLLPKSIVSRPKQPYRAPDSRSFFRDGKPLEYVAELLSPARLRDAGYFDPASTALLVDKCARGQAMGFGDNMSFVGILSTMLVDEMFVKRLSRLPESAAA